MYNTSLIIVAVIVYAFLSVVFAILVAKAIGKRIAKHKSDVRWEEWKKQNQSWGIISSR